MPHFDPHSGSRVLFFPTVHVAAVRSLGPYPQSSRSAWDRIFKWLDQRRQPYLPTVGYGLAYDNPQTSPAATLKYDACVPAPPEWLDSDKAFVERSTVQGGIFAVRRHTGPYDNIGTIISEVRDVWVPKSGLEIDHTRPVVSIFHDDPRTTPPEQQTAQVCLPVVALAPGRQPRS